MRLLTTSLVMLLCFGVIASAKILFDASPDGQSGIYVMDDDGSNITLLTEGDRAGYARWFPNGKKILFRKQVREEDVHPRSFGYAFFIMDTDGTNQQQITKTTDMGEKRESEGFGSFSPDGRSFVFKHTFQKPHLHGSAPHGSVKQYNFKSGQITTIADDVSITTPDWSPDGRYIVFSTPREIGGQGTTIWVMKSNGTQIKPLIPMPREGPGGLIIHRWHPKWSPDSQRVLYTQKEYTWEVEKQEEVTFIHLIHKAHRYIICDKNGSTIKELDIPPNLNCGSLDWMGEDGKSVIFTARPVLLDVIRPAGPEQNFHIYKYDLETDALTQLTHDSLNYETVDWISDDVLSVSPKGKKTIQWGQLKAFLYTRYKTLRLFSSGLSDFFLQYLR